MIDVGRLRVRLGLDSRELQSGLAKARLDIGKFAGRIAAAAAPAAVGAAVAAAARSSFQVVDAQSKLAQSLDTTTRSVQVLTRAGDLAGVSMSGIEQATKDMTRRLSQAAAGGGPAVDALTRLRLTAGDLLKLPLDERIARVNQAMQDFVPEAERAAVAGQIFGEEGSIAMSRIDPKTIRQAARDVDEFKVALSEVQADNIEAANDAMSTLGVVMRGVGNQVAASMAPAITSLVTGFTDLLRTGTPLRGLLDGLGTGMQAAFQAVSASIGRALSYAGTFATFLAGRFVSGMAMAAASVVALNAKLLLTRAALMRTGIGALVVGVGELIYRFGGLVDATGGVGAAFDALKAIAIEVWERIADGTDLVVYAVRQMGWSIRADFYSAMEDIQSRWGGVVSNMAAIGGMIPGFGPQFRKVAEAIRETGDAAQDLGTESAKAEANAQHYAESIDKALGRLTAPLATVEALRAKLAEARAEMDNSGTSSQGLKTALDDLNAALSGTDSKGGGAGVDTVTRKVAGLESAGERASGSFNTFFKDMIKGSGDASDAISALADRMLDDLLDRAMSPLSDALGSMFDGLLSGLFTGGGGTGTTKPIAGLIAQGMGVGSFEGGGRTPVGPRAGGLDGRGGFLAMLHPNESVIDHTRDSGPLGAVRMGDTYVSVQGSNASAAEIAAAVSAQNERQANAVFARRQRVARARGKA